MNFKEWLASVPKPAPGKFSPALSFRQIWQDVEAVCEKYPSLCTVSELGRSVQGRPIFSVEVAHQKKAPVILVIANLHAMEHVGVITAVRLLERAALGHGNWTKRRLVVVPMSNPDGFCMSEEALTQGKKTFLRKNAHTVDLNRNFAINWDAGYYLHRLLPKLYTPGPAPLSEPETQALDQAGREFSPLVMASLHAFGDFFFLPWAGSREKPKDLPRMLDIANSMADRQPHTRYRIMQLGRRTRLFQAKGAEIDHFYGKYGALSFLAEIGPGPFSQPTQWFFPYRWFTPSSWEPLVDNILPALDVLAEV